MSYKYLVCDRPITVWTYPSHLAGAEIVVRYERPVPTDNGNCYGVVEFPEPVKWPVLKRYSMFPSDEMERKLFCFWLENFTLDKITMAFSRWKPLLLAGREPLGMMGKLVSDFMSKGWDLEEGKKIWEERQ